MSTNVCDVASQSLHSCLQCRVYRPKHTSPVRGQDCRPALANSLNTQRRCTKVSSVVRHAAEQNRIKIMELGLDFTQTHFKHDKEKGKNYL